jgi:hypothetical protein
MNITPIGQMIFWFEQVHGEVLKLVESLSDEQLAWQPHPSATSIAFNVWHIARWTDYVQSKMPQITQVLSQRLEPRQQVWHTEGLAGKWGLDSASLGDVEAGNDLGVLAVQIHLPGQAILLEYLRHCYTLEEQALAAIDDQQFQERRIDGTGLPDETVGHWLMWHLVHEWEHLGMMRYIQGMYDVNSAQP